MSVITFLLLLISLFSPSSVFAQTPTLTDFIKSPWPHPFIYPCYTTAYPEFHPLRPYPGNPCDPLIPQKDPEAPESTDPEKEFLTFNCAKSLNVSGTTTVSDVENICNMPLLPANPLDALGSCVGPSFISTPCGSITSAQACMDSGMCSWSIPEDTSAFYRCDTSTYDVCFIKRIIWDVSLDLSAATLPFSGNTEIPLEDPIKVNSYISWYLNGTINQAEQLPLDTYNPAQSKRITTYSGPLNKLYPKSFRDPLKMTVAETGTNIGYYNDYHNYVVACQKDLSLADYFKSFYELWKSGLSITYNFINFVIDIGFERLYDVIYALYELASTLGGGTATSEQIFDIFFFYGLDKFGDSADAIEDLIGLTAEQIGNIAEFLQSFRTDMAEACSNSNAVRRLSWVDSNPDDDWIRAYIPYSTQEDTTSEITVSVIPSLQPTDIDGTILAIGLAIDIPSDSRLYFPHFRSVTALSEMLNAMHKPIYPLGPDCTCNGSLICGSFETIASCTLLGAAFDCEWNCFVPEATPASVSYNDNELIGKSVKLHQGISDDTDVQGEDVLNPGVPVFNPDQINQLYYQDRLIRNTEIREGFNAPQPLYIPTDPVCDIEETRVNTGDKLLGKEVDASLIYFQLFRYSPMEVIDCAGGCNLGPESGGTLCVTEPCVVENEICNITDLQCCTDELQGGYNTDLGNCPFKSECEHTDAEFFCTTASHCDPADDKEIYSSYSCSTRDGLSSLICCGPSDDPKYSCLPKSGHTNGCYQNVGNTSVSCSYSSQSVCESVSGCVFSPDGQCCLWGSVSNPDICYDAEEEIECNLLYCNWEKTYDGHTIVPNPPFCPAWPDTSLRSAARVHPFTKTPFIEKIYDLLVANPQSLLHRWLPKLPLSATSSYEIKTGIDNTIPAATVARYSASTESLSGTRVTAGIGGSGALYFPHVGSLADHVLGLPTGENLNLQRMLRPKGFVGWVTTATSSSTINCNTNVPDQNFACVDRDNYIDVAERWTTMPEGTHAELCFNDTVYRADQAGVNPGLSLLIWLNESDASNYLWTTPVEDFGVHTGEYAIPNDFNMQITGHLLTVNAYKDICASAIATYGGCEAFAARYLGGNPDCIPTPATHEYCEGLLTKWSWISSCSFPFP